MNRNNVILGILRFSAKLMLAGAIAWILLEAGLAVLCAAGVLRIQKPSYQAGNVNSQFWVETNRDVGVWHGPNSSYRHITASYDVTYRANSYGARDRERTREAHGKRRVVVLGDSFTEGYGVKADDRFTDRLEAATGVEHLNFGTAGSFGPTQYHLLYKTLAKTFDHDAVMVCLLPFNDFLDDDYEYGKVGHASRYRPYLVGEEYKLVYSMDRVPPAGGKTLEHALREFTYTGNLVKRLKGLARHGATGLRPDYSGYYDYTPSQWARLCHVLGLIREEARGKDVLVLTIPAVVTLERAGLGDTPAPLPAQMEGACRSLGLEYVDLLPCFLGDPGSRESCYFATDPHWNAEGNARAAEWIRRRWRFYSEEPSLGVAAGPGAGGSAARD